LTSNTFITISVVACLAVLSGCVSRVTVNNLNIPDPLIKKIPISVAVKFPDEFEHFVHKEETIGREKWTIDLGRSNTLLFTKLLEALFNDVIVLDDSVDPLDIPAWMDFIDIDAVIAPSIDAFEFSVPSQNQTSSFTVWVRYRIKIFDREGEQFANWLISAYGKSQKSTTMSGDDPLHHAAVLAMRDAAALILIQLDKATGISSLSREPLSNVTINSTPAMSESTLQDLK
jgi:hypothetical protein